MDAERTTRDLDAFVDLILADPEFLKAEFEALMSDAWSPPGATIRCAVGTHRPRRPATWSLGHVAEDSILGWTPRRLGRTRQRSPPHKDGHSWGAPRTNTAGHATTTLNTSARTHHRDSSFTDGSTERVNAYRLLLEGPNFSEEITIDAATIIEATQVVDEYLALLKALNDPAEGQHPDAATTTATPSQFQLRIELAEATPLASAAPSG